MYISGAALPEFVPPLSGENLQWQSTSSGTYVVTVQLPRLTEALQRRYSRWEIQHRDQRGSGPWETKRMVSTRSSSAIIMLPPGRHELRVRASGPSGNSAWSNSYRINLPLQGKTLSMNYLLSQTTRTGGGWCSPATCTMCFRNKSTKGDGCHCHNHR